MANPVDRAGRWAAYVKEVRSAQSDSGSIMLYVTLGLAHLWDPTKRDWQGWQQYDMEAKGSFCLVTKAGALQEDQITKLAKALDWDGDPDSLATRDWASVNVQCTTDWDDYKGGGWKIKNIFHVDSNPDQRLNLNPETQMRFQALARAARTGASATPPPVAETKSHTPPPIDMSMHAPVKDEPPY